MYNMLIKRLNQLISTAVSTGSRDGAEERRNGSDGVGGEHTILVNCVQCSSAEPGTRRSGLATAAE